MPRPPLAAGLLLALAATSSAQGLTFANGPSLQSLDVLVADELHPGQAGTVLRAGVEFLPIEHADHLHGEELATDRARWDVRQGLQRLELPGGGRVFRYRLNAGQTWGFLLVPATGNARILLERPGTGATGLEDPFADRLGLAADGLHALAPLANGGTYVLALDGSTFPSTGSPARLVPTASRVAATSAMVGSAYAFWISDDDHLWRCPLQDLGQPVDCTPPRTSNDRFKPSLAMSGDGTTVAALLGPRQQQSLWLLRETGGPLLLPPPPSKYEEPNYLPEGTGDAHLLLDRTGSRLFYVDAQLRDELHLLDTSGVLPDLQVTENQIFQPYLGVHILPAFVSTTLVIAIGDLHLMDWFSAALTPGGGQVNNLTGTGSLQQPYPAGALDPTQVAALAGGRFLTTDIGPTGLQLRAVDSATGTSSLLGPVAAPPIAGSSLNGPADLVVPGNGDRLFVGGAVQPFAITPPGIQLTPPSRGPLFAATWVHMGNFGLPAFWLQNGTVLALGVVNDLTQIVLTAAGGCVLMGPTPRYLGIGVDTALSLPPANVRICLSGAGG